MQAVKLPDRKATLNFNQSYTNYAVSTKVKVGPATPIISRNKGTGW